MLIEKRKYPAIAKQKWSDVFFMHWRVEPNLLQGYVQQPYELDLFDGSAWISVVCFIAKKSRLRFIPIDFVSTAIQTNVRTYVTVPNESERGVYFLKLYLNNQFAVSSARFGMNLPFQHVFANASIKEHSSTFQSEDEREPKLHVTFRRKDEYDESALAQFLTERYAIWNQKGNRLIKIPITHPAWRVLHAEVAIHINKVHPLIQGREPDIVHAGDEKLTHLYPYETVGFIL